MINDLGDNVEEGKTAHFVCLGTIAGGECARFFLSFRLWILTIGAYALTN